jgi:hypothetical protein
MKNNPLKCPHCQKELMTWEPSPYTGWGDNMLYCDNNECGYFVRGREKICREYDRNFAYRYCYNPKNGQGVPIIAWCYGELSLKKGKCKVSVESEKIL